MNPLMKAWSLIGLLFMAAIFATIPVSPQVTEHGVELSVDQAQAQITYGRYRRVTRRAYRAASGYHYYGWVPKYGPPGGAYPSGYYQPYYPTQATMFPAGAASISAIFILYFNTGDG